VPGAIEGGQYAGERSTHRTRSSEANGAVHSDWIKSDLTERQRVHDLLAAQLEPRNQIPSAL
jgi:hypothetical protein